MGEGKGRGGEVRVLEGQGREKLERLTILPLISLLRTIVGFIIKVKKILECICVQCGRLKVDAVRSPPPYSSLLLSSPCHLRPSLLLTPFPPLLVDVCSRTNQEDPAIRQIVRRIPPKDRLKYIWDKAKSVSICTPDDVKSEDDPSAVPDEPKGIQHHGCGHVQPVVRKEGLKLFVVYKKSKEEDEEVRPTTPFLHSHFPCQPLGS